MQIYKHDDFFLLANLSDFLTQKIDFGVHFHCTGFPFSIQVKTGARESIVPVANPIWVDHGYDFKQKRIS